MADKIELLDHGFVRFVEGWGHGDEGEFEPFAGTDHDFECGIIEAARQSTQGSFRGWDEDRKLLKYLHDHKHATPFEFAGMVIEVRAPIMVFREWHRHRTQSYNEMSGRYAALPSLWYIPTVERLMIDGGKNKQAGTIEGACDLSPSRAEDFRCRLIRHCEQFDEQYQLALKNGVPKELARCGMPVNWYSQMRAATCLRNWLAFLTLRLDPAAQWEIRQYAEAVNELIRQYFPQTWSLFNDARKSATDS